MNEKALATLEFPKIRSALAGFTSFSASSELAEQIRPTRDIALAATWQKQTTEARKLLATSVDFSLGGLQDIRPLTHMASHGSVLTAEELLSVKNSLIIGRGAIRSFERMKEEFPALAGILGDIEIPSGIVDSISKCISERGEVVDSASERLGNIRREIKHAHERLLGKLERIINDSRHAPMLQESIITQRDGRYVIPLRSEYKGQIKSIIHDQSSSGATLFVEPLVVVELNNEYKELQLAERDEERIILAGLSSQVGMQAENITALLGTLAELDLVLAKAKYADSLSASEPLLKPIIAHKTEGHPGSVIKLYRARHPLLDPAKVVPIDLDLDQETYALIITGPNTGGKTVTLKTLGLLALMAQSGMHIPALSGSEISVFDYIFADIGDEQSIEQSLSTFSGHITNIIQILKKADGKALVLLDELGAGTDPQEGAALAMAIVKDLLDRRITCMVATHYPELKSFAHNTRGVMNASLEFDLQTLKPTYHLSLGLPGRSNALAIAERLGLPSGIIAQARTAIHPDELKAEDLLDEIYLQRRLAREAREQTEKLQQESSLIKRELANRLEKIEDERLQILGVSRKEMDTEMARLQHEIEQVKKSLLHARQPLDAIKLVQDSLEQVEEKIDYPSERKQVNQPIPQSPLRIGEKVQVISLGMVGIVTGLSENDAEVQIGRLRLRARFFDLSKPGEVTETEIVQEPVKPRPSENKKNSPVKPSGPGMELDIRGQRAEDALDLLDRYLDSAYSNGLPFVRIIHGKGTGRLRQVVREALHASPHVTTFESGMENEGGDGVTVAHLVND
jgi:DNA mismatch repair protein MutS2